MEWLTPQRSRFGALAALTLTATMTTAIVMLVGPYSGKYLSFGWDFVCFWYASHLSLAGAAADAYRPAIMAHFEATMLPVKAQLPFFYPPVFLLILTPFALLPFLWSLLLFLGLTGAAFATAIGRASKSRWILFAALASPAMLRNLASGQNGMLTAAILGGGLALLDRRPRLAGLLLGCMVIKPQLALAVPFALIFSRRWSVLGMAALSSLGLIGISVLVLGTQVWAGFFAGASVAQGLLENPQSNWDFLSGFFWVRQWGGSLPLSYATALLIAAGGLGLLFWAQRRGVAPDIERALIVLVSLLMTPYLLPYDLVVTVFPLAWLLMEWSKTRFPPWGKLVLLIGYALPLAPWAEFLFKFPTSHWWLCGTIGLVAYVAWTETRATETRLTAKA
jgi:hypothetical protein